MGWGKATDTVVCNPFLRDQQLHTTFPAGLQLHSLIHTSTPSFYQSSTTECPLEYGTGRTQTQSTLSTIIPLTPSVACALADPPLCIFLAIRGHILVCIFVKSGDEQLSIGLPIKHHRVPIGIRQWDASSIMVTIHPEARLLLTP